MFFTKRAGTCEFCCDADGFPNPERFCLECCEWDEDPEPEFAPVVAVPITPGGVSCPVFAEAEKAALFGPGAADLIACRVVVDQDAEAITWMRSFIYRRNAEGKLAAVDIDAITGSAALTSCAVMLSHGVDLDDIHADLGVASAEPGEIVDVYHGSGFVISARWASIDLSLSLTGCDDVAALSQADVANAIVVMLETSGDAIADRAARVAADGALASLWEEIWEMVSCGPEMDDVAFVYGGLVLTR